MHIFYCAVVFCIISQEVKTSPSKIPLKDENNVEQLEESANTEKDNSSIEHETAEEDENTQGQVPVKQYEMIKKQGKTPSQDRNETNLDAPSNAETTSDTGETGPIKSEKDCENYGEMGTPVVLYDMNPEEKKKMQEQYQKYNFNEYVSDKISVHRSLPDARDKKCKERGRYSYRLPPTSVIICFHNEAWSVLLRTVNSVLQRTKQELLQEILLIDDLSDMEHLKRQLDEYVEGLQKVTVFHSKERLGKGRCRTLGASMATGEVLTFLDSHCEVTEGWAEPLLDTLHRKQNTVVLPVVDDISPDTFQVFYQGCEYILIGGLNLALESTWRSIPLRYRTYRHQCDNVPTPTMTGGLFTISKKFFKSIGYYDEPIHVWGAEHTEFSLKIWMCGGSIEVAPCSHVGHVFRRSFYPSNYSHTSDSKMSRNLAKVAEVWLDHRSTYFYKYGGAERYSGLDVRKTLQLKQELKCKTFDWYLAQVYPEMFIPDRAPASGEIRNLVLQSYCLDSFGGYHNTAPGVFHCHEQGGNQHWFLSQTGEIRTATTCLEYSFERGILMITCDNNLYLQRWTYKPMTNEIIHPFTKQCLSVHPTTKKLFLENCIAKPSATKWKFQHQNINKIARIEEVI